MKGQTNYYELLGVSTSADSDAIHSAFRRQSKTLHPDTTKLPADEAAKKFHLLYEAYILLSDPEKRRVYDISLKGRNPLDKSLPSSSLGKPPNVFKTVVVRELRPLSGGELFSLLLLGIALLVCLVLGVGVGWLNGRAWQVNPSWLITIWGRFSLLY